MSPAESARAPAEAVLVRGEDSARARAAAAAALRRAGRIVLTAHERVDADGAGSALGLAHGLRALGLKAEVLLPSPLPENLRFLPGADRIPVVADAAAIPAEARDADAFVALDTGAATRLGALQAAAEAAPLFLNVDHHASNEGFGTMRWVDPTYAAVGTMAFELLCEMGAPLERDALVCLYTALVFDTGGFAFSNTDPRAHRMAAVCLERGVRAEEVTAALHRSRSPASWAFTAEALAGLKTADDGAIAWIAVPAALAARHGMGDGRAPDLVEVPVSLAATRLAFVLVEQDGGVRVSLRSRCAVGVHEIASRRGGGGHARAAGMTLRGSLEEAERIVLEDARAALRHWAGDRGSHRLPPQDA